MAKFCTRCGTPRPDASRFCSQCGTPFAESVVEPVPTPVVGTVPDDTAAAPAPVPTEPAPPAHGVADDGSFDIFPQAAIEPVSTAPAPETGPEPVPPSPSPSPLNPDTVPELDNPVASDPVPEAVAAMAAINDTLADTAAPPPLSPVNAVPPPPYVPVERDVADYAPPPANRTPMIVAGFAVATVLVAGMAWWAFSDIEINGLHPKDKAAVSEDASADVAPATVPGADMPYVDAYLTTVDETMATRGAVALSPVPGLGDAPALRMLPEGAPVTGRWVRGIDGVSRWFRVNGGGYLPDAAVIVARIAPVVRPFDMSSAFASALSDYFDEASAQHQEAMEIANKKGESEADVSGYAAVPGRMMHGVTVTGVGSHYEGSSIIFRENVTAVRNAFRAAGWRVDSDGTVMTGSENPESCSITPTAQWPETARLGATLVTCGV